MCSAMLPTGNVRIKKAHDQQKGEDAHIARMSIKIFLSFLACPFFAEANSNNAIFFGREINVGFLRDARGVAGNRF